LQKIGKKKGINVIFKLIFFNQYYQSFLISFFLGIGEFFYEEPYGMISTQNLDVDF